MNKHQTHIEEQLAFTKDKPTNLPPMYIFGGPPTSPNGEDDSPYRNVDITPTIVDLFAD